MDVRVLVSVLLITFAAVQARPSDVSLKTKRSANAESMNGMKSEGFRINLPMPFRDEFKLNISGHLQIPREPTIEDQIEIIFPFRGKSKEHCKFTYNYKTNQSNIDDEPKILFTEGEQFVEHAHFDVHLYGESKETRKLKIHINPNYAHEFIHEHCTDMETFEDFEYIHFKSGFHNITNISIQF